MTDAAGKATQIATWAAGPGQNTEPAGTTSLSPAQIASVDVRAVSTGSGDDVLLSSRASADAWWKSANETILQVPKREIPADAPPQFAAQIAMSTDMFAMTFTPGWQDETEATRAYEAHNAAVRDAVDPARLVDWQPGDGWEPICAALDVPVPSDPFPHVNSTADFRAMTGMD